MKIRTRGGASYNVNFAQISRAAADGFGAWSRDGVIAHSPVG